MIPNLGIPLPQQFQAQGSSPNSLFLKRYFLWTCCILKDGGGKWKNRNKFLCTFPFSCQIKAETNLELCTGIIGIFLLLQELLKLEPALGNCFLGENYWNFYCKKSNPGGSLIGHSLDFNKKENFWHILDFLGFFFLISSLSLVKDRTQ